MMRRPEMCHKRSAVLAWCIAESKEGRGPAVDDHEAFESAPDVRERVDARYAVLERMGTTGNGDLVARNRSAQPGSGRFTNLRRFRQRVPVGVRGEHGAREGMA